MHHRMILCEEVPLQPWIYQGMQRDLPRTICRLVEHFFWSFQKIYRNLKAKHEHERNWKSCFEEFRIRTMFANLFANDRFVIELSRKHRVVVPKPLVCFLELVPKLYSTDVFFGWANLVYFLNEKCWIFKCEVFFKLVGSHLNGFWGGRHRGGELWPGQHPSERQGRGADGDCSGQQIESVKNNRKKGHFFFLVCATCCFSCARLIRCLNAVSVAGEPNSVNCELWIADFMTLKCIEIHLKDITVKINDSWNIRIVVDIYNIYIYNISIYNNL